jgi:hypothetical protein
MIESPLLQELLAQVRQEAMLETMQRDIVEVLESRFGVVPSEFAVELRTVLDEQRLQELYRFAVLCPDTESFRARLRSSTS